MTKTDFIIDHYIEIEDLISRYSIKEALAILKIQNKINISERTLKRTVYALRNREIIPKHEQIFAFITPNKRSYFSQFSVKDHEHNIFFAESNLMCNVPSEYLITSENLLTKTFQNKQTPFFLKTILNLAIHDRDIFEKFNIKSEDELIQANEIRQSRIKELNSIIRSCKIQYDIFQLLFKI